MAGVDKTKAPMLQKQLCNRGHTTIHHVCREVEKGWCRVGLEEGRTGKKCLIWGKILLLLFFYFIIQKKAASVNLSRSV